jgi:lipopolysaccharide heptosyltransferase II
MNIDEKAIQKILYINLAFLGDIILSTPTLRALRHKFPAAAIHMLVTPWAEPAAAGNPYIDRIHRYDKRGRHRNLKNLWELVKNLRKEKYDLVICANFAVRGAMLAKVLGVRYRIGYDAQHAGIFLTHAVPAERTAIKHETENQLAVLKPLEIECSDFSLSFKHNPLDVENMHKKFNFDSKKRRIAVCPYGRHPLNSWTLEGYVEIVKRLSLVADCYLFGGKAEKERLEEINTKAGMPAQVLAGVLTIGELAAFLAECDLLITVDTGPMHLGGAVGIPILALFGRSDPRIWGPRGKYDKIVQTDLECVPCVTPRECLHHSCMKRITADAVISDAMQIVERTADRKPIKMGQ